MKIKTHAVSSSIFAKVINDLIIKDSKLDESYVCILLSLSSNSDKSLLPTVRVNNDIREFLCLSPTKGSISNLLCTCLLYTSPSPRDRQKSRMPSSA